MKKWSLLLLLLLFMSLKLSAQKSEEYKIFFENADGLSNLYRGPAPLAYRFLHTGTFFAYGVEFLQGEVIFNNKLYVDVRLNLNSHIDELYLYVKDSERYVVLNKDFVDFFTLGEKKFINIKKISDKEKSSPEPGYYELLFANNSVRLLKKTKKIYSERINNYSSAATNSKVERIFSPEFSYYLIRGKDVKYVKRLRDITSFLGVKRGEVKPFIREKDLDLRHNKDQSFTEIIKFIYKQGATPAK